MGMIEGDARVTIEFHLQTRMLCAPTMYTPWRDAFVSTEDDVMIERVALANAGYREECLRVVRVTTIEEIWKT